MVNMKVNYFIEVLMLICFIVMLLTAISLLSNGGFNAFGSKLTKVHTVFGITFLSLMILHIIFHLKILGIMTKNIFRKKIKG